MDGVDTLIAIDACVSGVNSAYNLFITSIIGEFHRVTTSNVSKLTLRDFTKSCLSIQRSSLEVIENSLNNGLSEIAEKMKETDAKDFSSIKSDIVSVLKVAYKNQTRLDIEAARSDVFRYALAVVRRTDQGVGQISAMTAANKSVTFAYIDRAGKRWNSSRYISTATRYEIIKGIYFAFILGAESRGDSELQLSDGSIINVSDTDKYSHPGAKLIPIQVVSNK